MRVAAVLLSLIATVSGAAVELNSDNFDELTAGKNAFVKFFAPWCGHCKAMKPAWDELGDAYADSSSVVIGDVDCTADETKEICGKIQVQGYPTVKYFTSETGESGEAYSGGRSINDLKTFVEESLVQTCDISNNDNCSEKEIAYVEKMRAKSGDDVAKELNRLGEMLKTAKMAADKKVW
eukprot:CAMPEP_0114358214 /NCGR_PEP_ID=MMETSP0101-20121206/22151_1 /TAXON_ID=38822 ORGANISM="Pteridomonas danica, Strain PT" /NCGR_SAMPLE_ID=MMETSP0101 /ASSEMBLY_ACC=CAM_ASM_000211 /LENGTH=179 /DNA_ID=CAMNT_0001501249 /DNA_START=18 /DNA_END=554 /DNA_ORIENTATION=+